jgi:hypothetical protein
MAGSGQGAEQGVVGRVVGEVVEQGRGEGVEEEDVFG